MSKSFIILKNQDKNNDKSPDFRLTMPGEGGKWIDVGAGWNKKSAKGTNMISCKLANSFKGLPGWHLTEDTDEKTEPMPLKPHQEPTADEEFIAM